jgi:LysM repeat protein
MFQKKICGLLAAMIVLSAFLLAAAQPAQAADIPPGFPCKTYYTVKSGDNLTKISERFDVHPLIIVRMNGLVNPALLYPGDVLCVQYYAVAGSFHGVQPSDNLTLIAKTYDQEADLIAKVNNLSNSTVYAGQVLFIPRYRKYFY